MSHTPGRVKLVRPRAVPLNPAHPLFRKETPEMNRMRALLAVTALAVLAIAAPASAQAASKGGETVTYTTNGYGNRP